MTYHVELGLLLSLLRPLDPGVGAKGAGETR